METWNLCNWWRLTTHKFTLYSKLSSDLLWIPAQSAIWGWVELIPPPCFCDYFRRWHILHLFSSKWCSRHLFNDFTQCLNRNEERCRHRNFWRSWCHHEWELGIKWTDIFLTLAVVRNVEERNQNLITLLDTWVSLRLLHCVNKYILFII